ncbi:MAG TPA: translation initiation factor IF-2 [Clostridia bacterium]|nr:translation initiation factor IF-2 [Clostridia bacterium]
MAKAKVMDSAKELEAQARDLFERIKKTHSDMGGTLAEVRRFEAMLIEKEKNEAQERIEAERAERLKELLESDRDHAYHVGDEPAGPEPAREEPAAKQEPAPAKAEEPAPAKAEEPAPAKVQEAPAPKAEEPAPAKVQEAPAAEEKPQQTAASAPAQPQAQTGAPRRNDGYQAQPQVQNVYDRQRDRRPSPDRPAREGGYQPRTDNRPPREGGYQPRTDNRPPREGGYPPRTDNRPPREGGYPPRTDNRPQGGYPPRTDNRPPREGGYPPRTDTRPPREGGYQQGGYQPRTQGGYQQGGYQPRTQGGYQQRDGYRPQGGFQNKDAFPPRDGARPGGYPPRAPGARPPQGGVRPPRAGESAPAQQQPARSYDPTKNAPRSRTGGQDDRRAKNKKTLMKEAAPSAGAWDEEGAAGARRRKRQQAPPPKPEPVKIEKAVITSETITVKDLSEKIGKPAAEIIKKLFILGILATINQEIDFDTCSLIASDYGIELERNIAKTAEEVLNERSDETDSDENLVVRPPVVTIMGHVDHGKTSLLDAIRHTSVTEGEAGGITQHIGAYTVSCNGKAITFIDTPGHEAFTSMRARGAQVTDIVILVVAADDGIMPQTVEAINHSKAANVPIIVALNKMDKESANPERIKQQLTEYGLVSEEWGGDTICVPVSAKTRMGLDTLLEMILLQADVLELRANPARLAKGAIIEAELDKGRGPIATVLVQNGTLKIGDTIVAGTAYGRVRAMVDDKGRRVAEAGPSMPVEVLGFSEVPSAGDTLNVAEIDKLSRQVAEERRDKQKAEQLKNLSKVSLDDLFSQIAEGEVKDLNVIVKADVQGSVEAVKQALEKLSNDEVRVRCIHGGVGAITDTDIMFASASNAIVIGFNVRPNASARAASEKEKVDMRLYRIIYNAIEDIQNAMKGMFKPVFKEVELGHASVRSTFKVSGVGTIAGAYVQEGKVSRSAQVRVVRGGIVVHEGKIASLKRFKDDAKEVAAGYECGIGIENFNDIQEGDVIEAFVMEEVKR